MQHKKALAFAVLLALAPAGEAMADQAVASDLGPAPGAPVVSSED